MSRHNKDRRKAAADRRAKNAPRPPRVIRFGGPTFDNRVSEPAEPEYAQNGPGERVKTASKLVAEHLDLTGN